MAAGHPSGPVAGPSLAEVLRVGLRHGPPCLPSHHWSTLRALLRCRTPALGGHRYRCRDCGRTHFVPHSCRNRHCPLCQGQAARQWLAQQEQALLPVPYFHLVFTLPHALNPLIRQNQRALYTLLFTVVSRTLLQFGQNRLGAQVGITAVLHTWSQTLLDHYHLHCIVTGGGLNREGSHWVGTSPYFLFPVAALSKVFRGRFCSGLEELFANGKLQFHGQLEDLAQPGTFKALLREASTHPWVVYAKRPFAGPKQVLAYLSRYTHRVAISPSRLLSLDYALRTVCFSWKDYADGAQRKTMCLPTREFVRRFCLHLLPRGFVKIRHFGLLGNRNRLLRVAQARQVLATPRKRAPAPSPSPSPPAPRCPHCGSDHLLLVELVRPLPRVPAPRLDSS